MTYMISRIPVTWSLDEIDQLDWLKEPFNDANSIEAWDKLYGPIYRTGFQADFRASPPSCNDSILASLDTIGMTLSSVGLSYYKMMPGDLLPYHSDTYARYRACHGVDIHKIWRIIVFLQEWQPGFLFEIEGQPVNKYQAGDLVAWRGAAAHMAGNLGRVPRYTLQITGVLD